jgi:SAM-dependent methyltransferase
MNEQVEKEFDRYARAYEADLATSIPGSLSDGHYFAEYKIEWVARRMAGRAQTAVLDFGCGVGLSLALLKQRFPHAALYGYDVSSESLNLARSRAQSAKLTDDADSLPARGFDVIFAANVFHHIPVAERIAAFRLCRDLLREDGRFFLFEHNPLNPLTRYVFERCSFDRDAEMIPRPEAMRLAGIAGLSVVRADYTLFFPKQLALLRPLERLLGRLPIGAQYCIELSSRTPDGQA